LRAWIGLTYRVRKPKLYDFEQPCDKDSPPWCNKSKPLQWVQHTPPTLQGSHPDLLKIASFPGNQVVMSHKMISFTLNEREKAVNTVLRMYSLRSLFVQQPFAAGIFWEQVWVDRGAMAIWMRFVIRRLLYMSESGVFLGPCAWHYGQFSHPEEGHTNM